MSISKNIRVSPQKPLSSVQPNTLPPNTQIVLDPEQYLKLQKIIKQER
jgi:hypothetical protein